MKLAGLHQGLFLRILVSLIELNFSDNPADATKYEFIVNGCPDANEDSETLSIISNGQAAAASFSLASFQFNNDADAEIYIHCQVNDQWGRTWPESNLIIKIILDSYL